MGNTVDEYFAITEQQNESSDISKLVIMKSAIKGFFLEKHSFPRSQENENSLMVVVQVDLSINLVNLV